MSKIEHAVEDVDGEPSSGWGCRLQSAFRSRCPTLLRNGCGRLYPHSLDAPVSRCAGLRKALRSGAGSLGHAQEGEHTPFFNFQREQSYPESGRLSPAVAAMSRNIGLSRSSAHSGRAAIWSSVGPHFSPFLNVGDCKTQSDQQIEISSDGTVLLDDVSGQPIRRAGSLSEISVDGPCLATVRIDRPPRTSGCRVDGVLHREDEVRACRTFANSPSRFSM